MAGFIFQFKGPILCSFQLLSLEYSELLRTSLLLLAPYSES